MIRARGSSLWDDSYSGSMPRYTILWETQILYLGSLKSQSGKLNEPVVSMLIFSLMDIALPIIVSIISPTFVPVSLAGVFRVSKYILENALILSFPM